VTLNEKYLNEKYLAGCILYEESVIRKLDGVVTAEDFEDPLCKAIFVAATEIKNEGGTVDPASILPRARRDGTDLPYDYIKDLLDITPTAANFAEYGCRVATDAKIRRLKEFAAQIQEDNTSTPDELLAKVQQEADRLRDGLSNKVKHGITVTSATDLQRADLSPTVFLITGILPEGTSIISAASKIGKSWMVLDMGLSIATGSPFMGHNATKCGVLYLALEDSLGRLQDRMKKILAGSNAPPEFFFATEAPTLDNGLLDALDSHLQQHPDTKLIIIDTLQKIRGRALPRESSYEQDYREMGTVKAYMDKKGVSVLFVHHNRKMKDEDDPFNMISGTNGIMGAADTIWAIIKGKRTDNEATLHITGRDVEQSDTVITFDKSTWKWKPVGAVELIAAQRDKLTYYESPIVKTIKELLKKNGEWKGTATDLITAGRQIFGIQIAPTAQKLGRELNKLDGRLLEYDGIIYDKASNGSGGGKHYFYYHGQHWTDELDQYDDLLPS